MLGHVQPTEFDLRFSLFGIPVRVTPMFWLGSVILGWGAMQHGPPFLLMWVLVCFVSILVHEMGHALVARWMGCHNVETALYVMGGVATYRPGRSHTPGKDILIALAGPGAGFILWGLMEFVFAMPILRFSMLKLDPNATELIASGIHWWVYINLWWGLVNLLPVLPLDGGQVCRSVCQSMSPFRGENIARSISIALAGMVAFYFLTNGQTRNGGIFLYLAMMNFQAGR